MDQHELWSSSEPGAAGAAGQTLQPEARPLAIHPAQAIPVRLEVDQQRAHLTQDWQATLCGERLPGRVTWPDHYSPVDCRVCLRLANESGLKIERQA